MRRSLSCWLIPAVHTTFPKRRRGCATISRSVVTLAVEDVIVVSLFICFSRALAAPCRSHRGEKRTGPACTRTKRRRGGGRILWSRAWAPGGPPSPGRAHRDCAGGARSEDGSEGEWKGVGVAGGAVGGLVGCPEATVVRPRGRAHPRSDESHDTVRNDREPRFSRCGSLLRASGSGRAGRSVSSLCRRAGSPCTGPATAPRSVARRFPFPRDRIRGRADEFAGHGCRCRTGFCVPRGFWPLRAQVRVDRSSTSRRRRTTTAPSARVTNRRFAQRCRGERPPLSDERLLGRGKALGRLVQKWGLAFVVERSTSVARARSRNQNLAAGHAFRVSAIAIRIQRDRPM